jgi:ferrous iron transport protein A
MTTTDLSKLALGSTGRVMTIGAIGPMRRRLMDMGIVPGELVKVTKVAPLGDPIEISVKSYSLSLRKKEAEGIAVEVTP